MCDFEENETVYSVYPDAKQIDRNQAIEILKNHNCTSAIEHLEII